MAKRSLSVDDIVSRFEPDHQETLDIEGRHDQVHDEINKKKLGKSASYDDMMDAAANYADSYMTRINGGGKMSTPMARHKAREMFRIGSNGKDIRQALAKAQRTGSMKEVYDAIHEGFKTEEMQAYDTDLMHTHIGDDKIKRESLVKSLRAKGFIPLDILDHIAAGRYDSILPLRKRYLDQLNDGVRGAVYRG